METVLVVDDAPENVDALAIQLQEDGYIVFTARSGLDAMKIGKQVNPDVILMDIVMPGMDGIECCKLFKTDSKLSKTPVILISAKDSVDDVLCGLDAGAMDYISKPFNYSIVAARVRVAVRMKSYMELLELRNEQISEAKNQAEKLSQTKSLFLASMSHELRTPINSIMGVGGLLQDTELDPEQREYLDMMTGSSEALFDIINDILDLSKIEAQALDIEPIKFDVRRLIEEVAELLSVKTREKGLNLQVHIGANVPTMLIGDPGRIRQIILNYVSNAIKFTSEGHVLINVNAIALVDNLVRMEFSVEDTGIGIAQERLPALWDHFTQAEQSTTRRYGGTGLGLSICKKLTELMGGEVHAESVEGLGSKFFSTIELPFCEQSFSEEVCSIDFQSLRALVLDDFEVNRWVTSKLLSRWGIWSDCFSRSDDALLAIEKAAQAGHPYDLCVLDKCSRGEYIGEFVQLVQDAHPGIHFVLCASYPDRGDSAYCEKLGIVGYLERPVRETDLRSMLVHVLSGDERGASNAVITKYAFRAHTQHMSGEVDIEESIGANVLLAEDNIVNQRIAAKLLDKLGCHVDIANNGLEALRMFDSGKYDLILMDCHMPEMDGYETAKKIRENESGCHTPIIALTARSEDESEKACLLAGMDQFIAKPLRLGTLQKVIESARLSH